MVPGVTVDNDIININSNNVTLTLSWGEPFNNLDPIVNYIVSCSGDDTCPPNFTTTDNTTKSFIITNLIPITNYTFSVVASNSIGSGEAGVVMIIIAMSNMSINITSSSSFYIKQYYYYCYNKYKYDYYFYTKYNYFFYCHTTYNFN